jgi:hypothetical protein
MDTNMRATLTEVLRLGEAELQELKRDGDLAPIQVLVLPDGRKAQSVKPLLDEYLPNPERRKGTAELHQLESFIAHVNRFKDPATSVVFAQAEKPLAADLVAVLDYHPGAPRATGWLQHRALYRFPVSDSWKAWVGKQGAEIPLAAFAEFLEDRIRDVRPPDEAADLATEFGLVFGVTKLANPQELLELARSFSVRSVANVTNAVRLSSGESQFHFSEEHQNRDGSGPVTVPGGFLLGVPVLRGGEPIGIPVRLRYRLKDAHVVFVFQLAEIEKVWERAVGDACAKVIQDTGLPLFYGKPET